MKKLINFSSRFRILKGGKISLVVSAVLGSVVIVNAAPSVGIVTSGSAIISQNGAITNIDQSTAKASINWQTFNIASNETVNFNQPNSSSITLNRVIGNEKSVIEGAMNANGQVWLLNSNGVLFGKNASINTSGLLATTAQLSDEDFQNGNYEFKNSTSASVINQGTITIENAGSVVLASNEVINSGTIKAVRGKVHLVGADSYSLNLNGNSLVNLKINKGVLDALVENSGHIIADGGEVYLSSNAVDELLKGVVNNEGIIEANSIDNLLGKVQLTADEINLKTNSIIDAKGEKGGGEVLVGGDWQGSGDIKQATKVTMETDSIIDASATVNGDGGKVVLWSDIRKADSLTTVKGTIKANGGANGGDGGKIETSGRNLQVNSAIVSTLASDGSAGNWLLDPGHIVINNSGAVTSITDNYEAPSNVYISTSAVLNALNNNNVTITTGIGGAYVLELNDPLNYTGSTERTLTLASTSRMSINSNISSSQAPLNLIFASEIDRTSSESFTASGDGVGFYNSTIQTNGGDVWVGGGELSAAWNGHTVGVGAAMGGGTNYIGLAFSNSSITTNGGDVRLVGTTGKTEAQWNTGISAFNGVTSTISVSTGNVDLITDELHFNYEWTANDSLILEGSGLLSILPFGDSFATYTPTWQSTKTNGYYESTGSTGTFNGLKIQDTFGLAIGKEGNTSNVTIGSVIDIAGPISIYGGNITVNQNLTSTASGADILLKATANSIIASNLTTDAGDIKLYGDVLINNASGVTFSTGANAGDINFYNKIDSGTAVSSLVLNAGIGNILFNADVGTTKEIDTLSITSNEITLPSAITTQNVQTYNANVKLANDTTLTTTNSDIIFNGIVNSVDANSPKNLTTNILADSTYYWVDWTSATATHVYGTITIGGKTINVTFEKSVGFEGVETNNAGTNYWTGYIGGAFTNGISPYVSANVANGPTGGDIIRLSTGGNQTLTFSESIENLAFSVVSMNGGDFEFNQDFDIESYTGYDAGFGAASAGYYGGGTMVKTTTANGTYKLTDGGTNTSSVNGNSEPHGTLRFENSFSELTWTDTTELWHGFTIGTTGASADAGKVIFNNTVGGIAKLNDIDINAAMQTTADITSANSLDVSGFSNIGGNITTTANQNFQSAINLTSDVTLTTTTNGNVSTNTTIDGAHNLTINTNGTGDTTIGGAIGVTTALKNVSIRTDVVSLNGINVENNSNITIANRSESTISDIIAGSGVTFTKDETGTLILTGDNTYTGATTISNGTLQIGNGGTTGSIATTSGVTNNGTLKYYLGEDISVGYIISGNGNVEIKGSSSLLFGDDNAENITGFITTTPQTVATNTTVLDVLERLSGGRMNGAAISNSDNNVYTDNSLEAGVYNKSYNSANNEGTFQVKIYQDGGSGNQYTKVVFVKLTQSGNDVQVQAYIKEMEHHMLYML